MRYCISSRQTKEFLEKADEILVQYRDLASLIDLIEEYPGKDFSLQIPKETEIDWDKISAYSKKITGTLYCRLSDVKDAQYCKQNGLKFYYMYPVSSYFELRGLVNLGVSYVFVTYPLFFDLDNVKTFNVPLRFFPNLAYDAYIPRMNGVHGQWIRPEDMELYETYGEVAEFYGVDLMTERTLFKIYKEQKTWPGDLNLIFLNLNTKEVLNRGIDDRNIGKVRLNCRQVCEKNGKCHLCDNALAFNDVLRTYKKNKTADN